MATSDTEFPCSLTIHIPFPSNRLANAALRTLSVDQELSSLVQRTFSLVSSTAVTTHNNPLKASTPGEAIHPSSHAANTNDLTILRTEYKATTNRMLRVAVNGFFESIGTIVQVMEELDVDVLHEKGIEGLEGVQGVEQGMTGSTG